MIRTKEIIFLTVMASTFCACKEKKEPPTTTDNGNSLAAIKDDKEAKQKLQGIWIDEGSEDVLFMAKGDTIFYPDTTSLPAYFRIAGDTLYMDDRDNSYAIDKQTENLFWFHAPTGDIVKLRKSDNTQNDSMWFVHETPKVLTYSNVLKRDTVLTFDNTRYHAYININPTRYKVNKTSYTDEGISVRNVYYDNIIHICVYEGRKCLYSHNVRKKDFTNLVPEDYLEQAILSDMEFTGINAKGVLFKATVCIPDEAACYNVRITVSPDGEAVQELLE